MSKLRTKYSTMNCATPWMPIEQIEPPITIQRRLATFHTCATTAENGGGAARGAPAPSARPRGGSVSPNQVTSATTRPGMPKQ